MHRMIGGNRFLRWTASARISQGVFFQLRRRHSCSRRVLFGDEAAFIAKLDADKDERKSRHYRIALKLARDVLGGPA